MYTMDGAVHHGGPVSSTSAWIDPSAQMQRERLHQSVLKLLNA